MNRVVTSNLSNGAQYSIAALALLAILAGFLVTSSLNVLDLDFTQGNDLAIVLTILVLGWFLVQRHSELVGLILIAIIYANLSEVAVRFHGFPSILQVYFLFSLGLIFLRFLLGKEKLRSDPLIWALVALALITFASSAWAQDAAAADEILVEQLKGILIVFVLLNLLTTRREFLRSGWILVGVGAFLGTISLYQVLTSSYDLDFGGFGRFKMAQIVGTLREPRISGPLSDPNFYAQILIPLVPIALFYSWKVPFKWRILAGYSLAVTSLAVFFTYSRAGIVVLSALLMLALLLQRVRLSAVVLGVLLTVPVYHLIPGQLGERVWTLIQVVPGVDDGTVKTDSSLTGRSLYMRTAWEMFSDNPVLGVGAGNYSAYYGEYSEKVGSAVDSYDEFGQARYAHSLYLEIAAELGLLGLLLFAGILATSFLYYLQSFVIFRQAGDDLAAGVALSFCLGLAAYLTTSLFLHGHYIRYLWLLVALAAVVRQVASRTQLEGRQV